MTTTAERPVTEPSVEDLAGVFNDVNSAVGAARRAYVAFSECSLAQRRAFVDAVREAATQQDRLEYMASAAVEETRMGNAHHKVLKNRYAATRTPGVEDLVMEAHQGDDGLTTLEYSPYGVIGAVTPTTNPTETIICNTIGMLSAGNTVVFSPHPRARHLSAWLVDVLNRAMMATGAPANLITLIAATNAADIPNDHFAALTRLDHNRAKTQLARKTGKTVNDVRHMTIWGNHSSTQYPDVFHAEVAGQKATELVDEAWIENEFIPTVAKRGAAIIDARGASSAASAANATVECMRDWMGSTPEGDWVSMAIPSDGSYGVPEGLISSFPVTVKDGKVEIVQGLEIDDFSRAKIDASVKELADERDAVKELGLI